MKTLSELYTMLLERFNTLDSIFICINIKRLRYEYKIESDERDLLLNDFMNRKPSPTQYIPFYEHDLFCGKSCYVWFDNHKDNALAHSLRVQLLTNIIAELKDVSN
jgi:hypothetical protein